MHQNLSSARIVLLRNKNVYSVLHKINVQSFNSKSAIFNATARLDDEIIGFQMEQRSKKKAVSAYRQLFIWLTRTAEVNIDGRPECYCFFQKSVLTEFALIIRYQINIGF